MCGVFGWQLKAGVVGEEAMLALATVLGRRNDDRGGDGWGCWTPRMKRPVKGLGEFDASGAAELMAESTTAMGHTRKACSGSVVPHNSHPFRRVSQDGKRTVIGEHNGMVFNHPLVAEAYGIRYEVDSEVLIQMVADKRWEELAAGMVEGYGTLCWSVEGSGVICLSKMRMGQLSVVGIGTAAEPLGTIWSSDEHHLGAGLRAAGLVGQTFPYRLDEGEVVRAKNGGLFTSEKRICLDGRSVSREDARRTGMSGGEQGLLWRQ